MSGYIASYFEQYTGPGVGCGPMTGTNATPTTTSNCLLYVIAGVVLLSLAFEKKRKVPTK